MMSPKILKRVVRRLHVAVQIAQECQKQRNARARWGAMVQPPSQKIGYGRFRPRMHVGGAENLAAPLIEQRGDDQTLGVKKAGKTGIRLDEIFGVHGSIVRNELC